jgi:hypothetical protein
VLKVLEIARPVGLGYSAQNQIIKTRPMRNLSHFSSEKILDFGTVAFSFLFDKYYLIMD